MHMKRRSHAGKPVPDKYAFQATDEWTVPLHKAQLVVRAYKLKIGCLN